MPPPENMPSHITPVTIGEHHVGPGAPPFIVAEAGVNHNGSVVTALRMVDVAAEAGADAIKFQMFRATELVTASAPTASYQQIGCGAESQYAMLSRLELSPVQFASIKERCAQQSILFLATPFGESDVTRLRDLGVTAIKIASTDLTNLPLLAAVMATGLPMILSVGASTQGEIRAGVDNLLEQGAAGRLVLLHCVSCYPTPLEALNLRAVTELQRAFRVPSGLSDHSTSTETGGWAVAAGACVLEKHFTLDRTAPGPDQSMSLDPPQLREYITKARAAEKALGGGRLGMTGLEAEVRTVARKCSVATHVIPAGARLQAEDLTFKRPGTGIAPGELDRIIGRRAAVDIQSDAILSWDMLT